LRHILSPWIVAAALMMATATASVAAPPGIAATVNGHAITTAQVSDLAMRMAGPGITDQLVGNALVDQEAKRRNVEATPAEIDANIDAIRDQIKPQTLDDYLKGRNTTLDVFRNYLRVQIEVRKLLASVLKPVKMAHVEDILINIPQHTGAEARAVMAKIQAQLAAGKTFEYCAIHYSEDNGNNFKGGDIGVITDTPGTSDNAAGRVFSEEPAFLAAIFSLKKGEITQAPVKTVYGLHLIKVVSTGDDPLLSDKQLYVNAHNKVTDRELAAQAPKYVESLKGSGSVIYYLGDTASGPPGVAATVNGQNIMTSQVSDLASMTAGPTALERLIVNTLVDQESAKQDVAASPAEIDARVADIRNRIKPRILEDVLEQHHMSMDDLREPQRIQIEVGKLIEKTIPPFQMAHVRRILVTIDHPGAPKIPGIMPHSEAEAKEIIGQIQAQLAAGKSFEVLAQQYSEDTGSKAKGGDLGVITGKDPYDSEFLNAAFALKKGEVTKTPVRTSYGLELIEAVSTRDDPLPSDEQLYQSADQQAKKQETRAEMRGYIPALVARSKIAVYMPGVVVQSIGL